MGFSISESLVFSIIEIGFLQVDGSFCLHTFQLCCVVGLQARSARVLLGLSLPGHLFFILLVYMIGSSRDTILSFNFYPLYLSAVLIQVYFASYILLKLLNCANIEYSIAKSGCQQIHRLSWSPTSVLGVIRWPQRADYWSWLLDGWTARGLISKINISLFT